MNSKEIQAKIQDMRDRAVQAQRDLADIQQQIADAIVNGSATKKLYNTQADLQNELSSIPVIVDALTVRKREAEASDYVRRLHEANQRADDLKPRYEKARKRLQSAQDELSAAKRAEAELEQEYRYYAETAPHDFRARLRSAYGWSDAQIDDALDALKND